MSEQPPPESPEIDLEQFHAAMADSMKWASLYMSYEEVSEECKSIVQNMRRYSLESALPIIAGLLTIPEYQSQCIRLEVLGGLVTLNCKGKKKASLGSVARWYRQIGETKSVLGEDPAEDVFVTLVHDEQGNYRILEGVWENAGFYTQCVSDVVGSFQDEEPFRSVVRSFRALLKISEVICDRAGLERYQLGSDSRRRAIDGKHLPNIKKLACRAVFTTTDFDDLGITPSDIAPFLSHQSNAPEMLSDEPGNSFLDFRPLVQIGPGKFVLALPSAISVSARNLVFEFIRAQRMEEQFDSVLANVFSSIIYKTPILGGTFRAPTHWQKIKGVQFSGFSQDFDDGYTLSVQLFLPPLSEHSAGGFKSVIQDDGSILETINKAFNKSVEDAKKRNPKHKGGLALIVACGWGKGVAVPGFRLSHKGWVAEFIPISDLVRVSWLSDMSPEYFFRIQQGLVATEKYGLDLFNINGVLNLIAWSRQNDGHIIPHHFFLDGEHSDARPNVLHIPQNLLRDLRQECDFGRDLHRVLGHDGRWHIVQRVHSETTENSDGSHKLYASLEDAGEGKFSAVLDTAPPIWLSISAPNFDNSEIAFRLWEMARLWLPRIVERLSERNLVMPEAPPLLLVLIFEGTADFSADSQIPTPEKLFELVTFETDVGKSAINIVAHEGFMDGFRLPQNAAEQAIVLRMLEALLTHMGVTVSDSTKVELLNEIVQNDDARSFHAIQAHTFFQYVWNKLPRKLVALNEVDDAIVKLGMGLNKGQSSFGPKISGIEDCTTFLSAVVDGLLEKLHDELKAFNRKRALTKIYENIEKANAEEDHWRRTSFALLGLHGDGPDGVEAYQKNSSKFSGAAITNRVLAEIALCVCPIDSGVGLSNLELSRMMARAGLIFRLGGLSDAIKYNALPPDLHVSPFGDILFKDDLGEFVVQPMLEQELANRFKTLAPHQAKNYAEPEIILSAQDHFSDEFWRVWIEEMGFSIDQGRKIIDQVEDKGIKLQKVVYELKRSEFMEMCTVNGLAAKEVENFLNQFTLATRSSWDKLPKDFAKKEIYPWRMGRRLSLATRPILQINEDDDPLLMVAPNNLRQGFWYVVSGANTAGLGQDFFQTSRMKNDWWGKAGEGHTHTRNVANKLEKAGWNVRVEIELSEILNEKMPRDYGDVDVLAWNTDRNEILVIECKDLSLARNYTEVAHMLSEYQGGDKPDGRADKLKRHLDRCETLTHRSGEVGRFCEISSPKIRSALVCSGSVPMQFAKIQALNDTYVGKVDELISSFG